MACLFYYPALGSNGTILPAPNYVKDIDVSTYKSVVVMPSPEFSSSIGKARDVVEHTAYSGLVRTYVQRDRLGQYSQLIPLEFTGVQQGKQREFEAFCIQHAGDYIGYTDPNGNTIVALLVEEEIVYTTSGSNGGRDVSYDFEVQLQRVLPNL